MKYELIGKRKGTYEGHDYYIGYLGLIDEENRCYGYVPDRQRIKLTKEAFESIDVFTELSNDTMLFDKKGRLCQW